MRGSAAESGAESDNRKKVRMPVDGANPRTFFASHLPANACPMWTHTSTGIAETFRQMLEVYSFRRFGWALGALTSVIMLAGGLHIARVERTDSQARLSQTWGGYGAGEAVLRHRSGEVPGDDVNGCDGIQTERRMGHLILPGPPSPRICSETRVGRPSDRRIRFSPADIVQQLHDFVPWEGSRTCSTLDPGFYQFDSHLSTGYAAHPQSASCQEMQTFLYANGFAALISELEDMDGAFRYSTHVLAQQISIDAYNAGVPSSTIARAFRNAKNHGLCWGTLISGGLEHGMEWSLTAMKMGVDNSTWEDVRDFLGIGGERASSQLQVYHGVGHGGLFLHYIKVDPGTPLGACSVLGQVGEAKTKFALNWCMTAPQENMRAQCINGIYHEVFHHPDLEVVQNKHWGYYCQISPMPIPCWDYYWFGAPWHIEWVEAIRKFPKVTDACLSLASEPGYGESQVRGFTFGVSTIMFPFFRAMLASPNFNPEGSLEYLDSLCNAMNSEAHKMKVKMMGSVKYCDLLLAGGRTGFPKLLSTVRPGDSHHTQPPG